MTAIVGALWVLFTYLGQQDTAQANAVAAEQAAAARAATDAGLRKVELQRPFLDKQLALYFETAQLVGALIAMTPADPEWMPREKRFWALYWSELAMVEDPSVEGAMKRLGDNLVAFRNAYDEKKPHDEALSALRRSSLDLAHAIRDSIAKRWSGN
jgi:hypothetical protein